MSLVLSIYIDYLLKLFCLFFQDYNVWNVNISYSHLSLSLSFCLYVCMYVETESLFLKEKLGWLFCSQGQTCGKVGKVVDTGFHSITFRLSVAYSFYITLLFLVCYILKILWYFAFLIMIVRSVFYSYRDFKGLLLFSNSMG